MGLRAAMAFALLGLGGAAMVPGFGVYDIMALAGGSVAAGGISPWNGGATSKAAAGLR